MSEFTTLPKYLPPRNEIVYEQKIPKIIWQTMKTNRIPLIMKGYIDTWIIKNPEYEYRLYTDEDILDFLSKYFPQYVDAFKKIKYGASKADLWRYLIIYKYGGVYVDMDCLCMKPLREWINPTSLYVTQLGINKDICQWMIISAPGNPLFSKAAEKSLDNITKNNTKASHQGFKFIDNQILLSNDTPALYFNDNVLALAGPPVLQQVAEECYKDGSIKDILSSTQITCVSGSINSCQMNGNVSHGSGDNVQYKKALRLLKIPHYNNLFSRIKRKFYSYKI